MTALASASDLLYAVDVLVLVFLPPSTHVNSTDIARTNVESLHAMSTEYALQTLMIANLPRSAQYSQ